MKTIKEEIATNANNEQHLRQIKIQLFSHLDIIHLKGSNADHCISLILLKKTQSKHSITLVQLNQSPCQKRMLDAEYPIQCNAIIRNASRSVSGFFFFIIFCIIPIEKKQNKRYYLLYTKTASVLVSFRNYPYSKELQP